MEAARERRLPFERKTEAMICREVRDHWNLYHDSEGDADIHFRINEHLAKCDNCSNWYAAQGRLEQHIAIALRRASADPALWNEILVHSNVRRAQLSRRWVLFSGLSLCAAVLLLAVFILWYQAASHKARDLADLSVQWHERVSVEAFAPSFRSESDLDVESYVRKAVNFPIRCPPRKDAGFNVRGAGTCRIGTESVAYLVGEVEDQPVSIFIMALESLQAFPEQYEALRRARIHQAREGTYELAASVIDRNVVLVIGEADPDRLVRVLTAYATYPEPPAG